MKALWSILYIVGERKKYLVLLLFRIPFDFLLNLSRMFFLRDAFRAIEGGSSTELYRACIVYALASILLFSYNSIVWRLFAVMYTHISGKIRIAATDSLMSFSLAQVEMKTSGDLMTRLNLDADMTIQILGGALNIPHFVIALFGVFGASVFLVGWNVKVFLIVMSFILPHILLHWYIVAKPMTNLQDEVQDAKGKMNTMLSAMISMADTTALYDAESMLMENYKRASRMVLRIKMRMILRNVMGSAFLPLFGFFGYFVLLLYAGGAIATGQMQFGDFTAMLQLRNGILMGLFMGIRSSVQIRKNLSGLHRMNEMLSLKK